MDADIIGVQLHPLKIIPSDKGFVRHGLKVSDTGFDEFGEVYFSGVDQGVIKGWKKHTKMTMNLIVVVGRIHFVLFDDRPDSATYKQHNSYQLDTEAHYSRLTIPPGIYVAFQGLASANMLMNVASLEHQPEEAINVSLEDFGFNYAW